MHFTDDLATHPDLWQWFANGPAHRSRVSEQAYAGAVFVSSETDHPTGQRRYTVRVVTSWGERLHVDNVSPLGHFTTRDRAHRFARRFAWLLYGSNPTGLPYPNRTDVNTILRALMRDDWQWPDYLTFT